ncbi:MAG TPA: SRPBCC domain-containing protein [Reyranella sp.]|jgi:uncharacterized protein YndB with AHSA1/START domain
MSIAARSVTDELILTRDIAAPRARVFAAWTDARAASRWWVPQDCTPLSCEMDVRPGGAWRRRMRTPDGTVITKWGVYREVVVPERLVFTYRTESAGVTDSETLVTVTFADLGDRTRLTLRHTAFESDAARRDHQGGWTGVLERLATFIATEGAAP